MVANWLKANRTLRVNAIEADVVKCVWAVIIWTVEQFEAERLAQVIFGKLRHRVWRPVTALTARHLRYGVGPDLICQPGPFGGKRNRILHTQSDTCRFTPHYLFNARFLIIQLQAKDSSITLLATATVLRRQFGP
jgi:hypothetical protein